jgi:hypothetical protein
MKKYISLLLVLVMAVALSTQVTRAEENADSNNAWREQINNTLKLEREKMRAEWQTKIEGLKDDAKEKMEGLRGKIKLEKNAAKAKLKELLVTGREKALERFNTAIERINGWKDKVDTKISELDEKGIDVEEAEALIETVEDKPASAESKVKEINALLATSIDELTLANKTKLRTLAQDTQTLIVEAHKALRDAIKSLKDQVKAQIQAKDDNKEDENE